MVKDLTYFDDPFVLENKTGEVATFRYYLVNFVEKMNPGDKIEITPKSSEELAYYIKIQEGLETEVVAGELTPMDYAKIIYNGDNVTVNSCEIREEYEDRVDYIVTITVNGNTTDVLMSIYDPEEIVEHLDDGTPGPYTACSKYGSTVTYVNKQGVVIGHSTIYE